MITSVLLTKPCSLGKASWASVTSVPPDQLCGFKGCGLESSEGCLLTCEMGEWGAEPEAGAGLWGRGEERDTSRVQESPYPGQLQGTPEPGLSHAAVTLGLPSLEEVCLEMPR